MLIILQTELHCELSYKATFSQKKYSIECNKVFIMKRSSVIHNYFNHQFEKSSIIFHLNKSHWHKINNQSMKEWFSDSKSFPFKIIIALNKCFFFIDSSLFSKYYIECVVHMLKYICHSIYNLYAVLSTHFGWFYRWAYTPRNKYNK